MNYNERKKIFKKLCKNNDNLVWKPQYIPLMRTVFPFLRNFKVDIQKEEELPNDGVLIIMQNHCNFYDSIVLEKVMKNNFYCCFASDEPRGTIQGMGFEATGVVWVNRNDKESRVKASQTLVELLKNHCNLSWCPEGLWCLSENKLLLHISRGLAKAAIAGAEYSNVYIVPLVTTYEYDNNDKVKRTIVTLGKSVLVNKDMDDIKLTEHLEDIMWTIKWHQMEKIAEESKDTIPYEFDGHTYYLYQREKETLAKWKKHVEKLKSQLKYLDWNKEGEYEIKTKEERLQEEMETYTLKLKRR